MVSKVYHLKIFGVQRLECNLTLKADSEEVLLEMTRFYLQHFAFTKPVGDPVWNLDLSSIVVKEEDS